MSRDIRAFLGFFLRGGPYWAFWALGLCVDLAFCIRGLWIWHSVLWSLAGLVHMYTLAASATSSGRWRASSVWRFGLLCIVRLVFGLARAFRIGLCLVRLVLAWRLFSLGML
jgi:hypothetical protein